MKLVGTLQKERFLMWRKFIQTDRADLYCIVLGSHMEGGGQRVKGSSLGQCDCSVMDLSGGRKICLVDRTRRQEETVNEERKRS